MPLTHGSELHKKTVQGSFWNAFNFQFNDPFSDLVMIRPSDQATDTFAWLSDPRMPEEWVGDKLRDPLAELSHTLTNKAWESTVPVSKEMFKYAQLPEVARAAARLAEKARLHRTKLLSDLLNAGVSSTGYDGQNFFDTDHTDPGTPYQTDQDNDLTANIVDPTAPTDLEMRTALKACFAALRNFKDSQGDPIMVGVEPTWVVMAPPAYYDVLNQLATQESITGPIGNDLRGKFTIRTNQFMTAPSTTGALSVFNPSLVRKPFIMNLVSDVELNDTENDDNGGVDYSAEWWGNCTYGDWRAACSYIFT